MLTKEEEAFIKHWESVREEFGTISSKFRRGLPMALLFSLPIIFLIAIVYFFSPEWYAKISKTAGSSSFSIFMALFFIILFFSVARMHFNWEMNEQMYEELINKKKKQEKIMDSEFTLKAE